MARIALQAALASVLSQMSLLEPSPLRFAAAPSCRKCRIARSEDGEAVLLARGSEFHKPCNATERHPRRWTNIRKRTAASNACNSRL